MPQTYLRMSSSSLSSMTVLARVFPFIIKVEQESATYGPQPQSYLTKPADTALPAAVALSVPPQGKVLAAGVLPKTLYKKALVAVGSTCL